MFWFKKSKIILDCFTYRQGIFENCKIDHANKFFPEWWKKLPKEVYQQDKFTPTPTMKTCSGFLDLYRHGVIVPMWTDLKVEIESTASDFYRWQFADEVSSAVVHPSFQHGFDIRKYSHLKLEGPWRFKCNQDVNWLWIQPDYNMQTFTDYKILSGKVNLKHVPYLNINLMFIREEKPKLVTIEYKKPLVHLIPNVEKELEVRHHLVTPQEYSRIEFHRSHFIGSYEKQRKERKCPFHK